MIKRFLVFICVCLMLCGFIVVAFSHIATRPTPSNVDQLADNEQEITLKAEDGIRISASFFPATEETAPVILMLHGNGASRRQFQSHIEWLNRSGYAAMTLDFRGHGESQEQSKSFGLFEARDAEAAVNWIKKNKPVSKIGVIGVSLGGAAALLGENGPLPVDAIVLKAVYPDIDSAIRNRVSVHGGSFLASLLTPMLTYQSPIRYDAWPDEISPINAAKKFEKPVLVIGGSEDYYTPIEETTQLSEAFSGKHWTWVVEGLSHDQLSDLDDPVYQQTVLTFFDEEMDAH